MEPFHLATKEIEGKLRVCIMLGNLPYHDTLSFPPSEKGRATARRHVRILNDVYAMGQRSVQRAMRKALGLR